MKNTVVTLQNAKDNGEKITMLTAYDYSISTNEWKKYGKERLYLAVYETRENSKHNVKYDFGYIDLLTANYVAGKKDLTQNFDLSGARF